jgi:SAM-dependent methyltransferase
MRDLLARLRSRGRTGAAPDTKTDEASADYAARLAEEHDNYAEQEVVHDLPPIFHYWSSTHLLPIMQAVGIESVEGLFADAFEKAYHERRHADPARFASVGAGNCDAEAALAQELLRRGCDDFVIDCLELNPAMLERGMATARDIGVERHIRAVETDFNAWQPAQRYEGVLANQALHHVLKLESLYDAIHTALTPEGRFVTSDMIGRNGHMRWPEARRIVDELWPELPESYRFHRLLNRQESEFMDWDCSTEGFEGIRSQDVLPLLVERFHFETFLGFGNVIDLFIDRGFGPNFDPEGAWDRDFIDRVHARDVEGLLSGELKPTHIMAVMRTTPVAGGPRVWRNLTPERCVRR